MKNRSFVRVVFISAAFVAIAAGGASGTLLTPASAAAPSASASAASSALAQHPNRPVEPEVLEKLSLPTTPSPPPTVDEWKNAPEVEVSRDRSQTGACRVYRVREWLKVKCDISVGAIHQHSGNVENVLFWIRPKVGDFESGYDEKNGGELIFPMRVGDRRLLQFFTIQQSPCFGMGLEPSITVDETWIEGEPAPVVVLR